MSEMIKEDLTTIMEAGLHKSYMRKSKKELATMLIDKRDELKEANEEIKHLKERLGKTIDRHVKQKDLLHNIVKKNLAKLIVDFDEVYDMNILCNTHGAIFDGINMTDSDDDSEEELSLS